MNCKRQLALVAPHPLVATLSMPSLASAAEPIEKHPEWDQGYSQKIRAATTGPEFMTDLVDHLPASATVPTPEKINGYIAGPADHPTYADDVHRYMGSRAASPRVKVFTIDRPRRGGR